MDATMIKKRIVELRVVELKSELERRNLDRSGMKAVLLERLSTALKEEGHDPETVMIEVPDQDDNSGQIKSNLDDGSEDADVDEEEAETELNDSDKIVIPLSDVEWEQSHQDTEMNSEVADDAMVEDEEMVDEDHLLALEEEGGEEDQPADHGGAEATLGDPEDEDDGAEDFTHVHMVGEEDAGAQLEDGTGGPVECGDAVTTKTAQEDTVQSATEGGRTEHPKDQNASAAVPAVVSGVSVSSSTVTTSARPSVVKSSPVPAKKPATTTNTVGASKPSPASAKPVSVLKSAVNAKPTKAVPLKTAVKSVSSTKPGAGVQKPGPTPSKSVPVSKQASNTKSNVAQKMVTTTSNSSQVPKSGGIKVPDVPAITQTAGAGDSSGKDAAALKAGQDSFDVQVDDTMLNDIDADLVDGERTAPNSQVEAPAEAQTADTDASGPQPDEPSATEGDTSAPEQPPAATGEQLTSDAAKDQDSAQKDKPEEKKDQKDSKPVKSATTAAKPAKGKDDKAAANSRNLWVSGLSSSTRATDLKNLFGKYGKVVGAKVVTNARSPGWRCYGFVTMASADETTKCIQHLHRTELHGKMISVERFSSFKAKTGGPAKTAPSSKTIITGRSITGKPTPVTINTTKTTPTKKDDKKTPAAQKEGDKKIVKKEGQKEGNKDAKKDDQSKDKPDEKKPPKKDEKDPKKPHQGSRDRSRHRDPEKSREQRERDILSFEKIRAERERERLRQKELQLRCEERYRLAELDRERQRQKLISRKQRDEAMELEREKEKLRMEKERLEFERQEAERLRRETNRLKRIAEEKLRREQERLEEERRAIKRPAPPPKASMGDYWGEAAKQSRKEPGFKSVRDRDYRREERREDRGGHRDMREDFGGRDNRGIGSNGTVSGRGHGSRDSRKVSSSHHSWGTPADSHSKVDSGWGRGPEGNGGSSSRWMGSGSMGSQHQRGGSSSYPSHGSRGISSSGGGGMYMSSGPSHSSNVMSGGGTSRQQDARFNIAAITARRF